mmetsp:Transcript_136696/g.237344  ORF Transcript_136696/g.237344 Transcript_136696/m.237344 type:complete len:290 (+) Transcript_136696:2665-3534(+)
MALALCACSRPNSACKVAISCSYLWTSWYTFATMSSLSEHLSWAACAICVAHSLSWRAWGGGGGGSCADGQAFSSQDKLKNGDSRSMSPNARDVSAARWWRRRASRSRQAWSRFRSASSRSCCRMASAAVVAFFFFLMGRGADWSLSRSVEASPFNWLRVLKCATSFCSFRTCISSSCLWSWAWASALCFAFCRATTWSWRMASCRRCSSCRACRSAAGSGFSDFWSLDLKVATACLTAFSRSICMYCVRAATRCSCPWFSFRSSLECSACRVSTIPYTSSALRPCAPL